MTSTAVFRPLSVVTLTLAVMLCGCRQGPIAADGVVPQPLTDHGLRIDGLFADWADIPIAAADPAGDGGTFDLTAVRTARHGSRLYFRFDLTRVLNTVSGEPDEQTLLLVVDLGDRGQLTIDMRGRSAMLDQDGAGHALTWQQIDYALLPTFASDRFEGRIDLAGLGVTDDQPVTVQFAGSDGLASAIKVPAGTDRGDQLARWPTFAGSRADLRVASLNTLFGGLVHPQRQHALKRLIRQANADVYCFQEEWKTDLPDLQAALPGLNVHKQGGCVVASRWKLIPVPHAMEQAAMALVIDDDGRPTLIAALHLTCCGHIGNERDRKRIAEAQAIVDVLRRFRAGRITDELAPYRDAPIVAVGDYNLVGARTPLDVFTGSEGPGLQAWMLPHLARPDVYTWRSLGKDPFPPGRLDWLTFTPATLAPTTGFVFDSADIIPCRSQIEAVFAAPLVVDPDDSRATDHLMLVAGFRRR